jgi:hypothetical protein
MSKIKFTVAHRVDNNNVGDMASNPLQYFLKDDEYNVVDVTKISESYIDPNIPLIVGGGGLLNNEFIGNIFKEILYPADRLELERMWLDSWNLKNSNYAQDHSEFMEKYRNLLHEYLQKIEYPEMSKFVWGAGFNSPITEDSQSPEYPTGLLNFKLVGLRDVFTNMKHQWVPCASCMHPTLRKKHTIKNKVIWFEHKKQLIKDFGDDSIPRFVNSGSNIEQTIELLGSAETILTNSYHGAYWGTLLGKKVIVIGQWSNKFLLMKHPPRFLGKKENWKDVVESIEPNVNALNECISATENYWKQINLLL